MTASFHSKVGIFTPLRLNNYHVNIAKLIGLGRRVGRPELKSDETCDANVIVIENEITSQLCLKPLKHVVQLLAARPGSGTGQKRNKKVMCNISRTRRYLAGHELNPNRGVKPGVHTACMSVCAHSPLL
jgi:hypothetical protein